jgi:predicted NUDIX family phosphoesterase
LTPEFYDHIAHHGEFRVRAEVEEDESWRQIIPYAVLEQNGCVFTTRRLGAGTEARLHGYLSIGLGGHINPEDQGEDVLEAALRRELCEELTIGTFAAEAVGLIHTLGGVESVHTGILYRVQAASGVTVRETDKLSGAFMSWAEVAVRAAGLEGWSLLALDFLKPAWRRASK